MIYSLKEATTFFLYLCVINTHNFHTTLNWSLKLGMPRRMTQNNRKLSSALKREPRLIINSVVITVVKHPNLAKLSHQSTLNFIVELVHRRVSFQLLCRKGFTRNVGSQAPLWEFDRGFRSSWLEVQEEKRAISSVVYYRRRCCVLGKKHHPSRRTEKPNHFLSRSFVLRYSPRPRRPKVILNRAASSLQLFPYNSRARS